MEKVLCQMACKSSGKCNGRFRKNIEDVKKRKIEAYIYGECGMMFKIGNNYG